MPGGPTEIEVADRGWSTSTAPERVTRHVPDTGDIVFLDFDPQIGREQAKRRPTPVLTEVRYNRASGLAVVCPLTSKLKPYPFALSATVGGGKRAIQWIS